MKPTTPGSGDPPQDLFRRRLPSDAPALSGRDRGGRRRNGGGEQHVSTADPAAVSIDPPSARPDRDALEPAVAAVREDLPSARLARLAAATAAELDLAGVGAGTDAGLSEQAVADIRAAVQGSTAANTKAAYSSDWRRFTLWAGAGGHPLLPAPPWWWRTTSRRRPRNRPASGSGGTPPPR